MDEKDTMENRAEMESAEIRGEGMTGLANEAEQEAGVSVKPGENETGLADEARQEAEVPAPGESGSDLTADTSAVRVRRRQVKLLLLAVGAAVLLAVGLIVGSLVADHIRKNQSNVWPIKVDWEVKAHPTEDEAFELNKWYQQLYEDDPTWEDRLGGAMFDENNILEVYLIDGRGVESFRGKNVRLFGCKYTRKEMEAISVELSLGLECIGAYDTAVNFKENVVDLWVDPAKRGRIPEHELPERVKEAFNSPAVRIIYQTPDESQYS